MKALKRDDVWSYADVTRCLRHRVNEHLVDRTLDFFWLPWEGDDVGDQVWQHVKETIRALPRVMYDEIHLS
jgi:hypothetical protein